MTKEIVDISLVEQGVYRYPHKKLEGWRFYRLEYIGHAMQCAYEGSIWLPPNVDPMMFEDFLTRIQREGLKYGESKIGM